MEKGKKEPNPFDAFDILKGEFTPPEIDDDIITGDSALIEEKVNDLADQEAKDKLEQIALEKGDKALEKVIKIQAGEATEEVEEELEEEIKTNGYLDAIKDLSDKGVLDIDPTTIEDSEEGFEKAIQETVNNKIKNHIATFGEGALDFLAYIENGGDPKKFISTFYNEQSWENYTTESEASQKIVIRESLKLDGYEPEEIEDMITEFEDNGTLEKRSKPHLNKLQKAEKTQKIELVEFQKQKADDEKNANKKYWEDFKKDLDSKTDLKGFKVTPKIKDNLWSYMTVIDKSSGKTAYQKAIDENKDSSLLFAYLAMNNFDISKLETQLETKVASKVSGILKNYKTTTKDKISSGRSHIDVEGSDPFAGFGK